MNNLVTQQELIKALREVNAEQQRIIIDLMVKLDNAETKLREVKDNGTDNKS